MSEETKAVDTKADAPGAAPTLAKIPRARLVIQQDFSNTAAQLGALVLQIAIMKQQRDGLMQKLDSLNREASELPPEPPKAPKLVPQPPKAGSDGT